MSEFLKIASNGQWTLEKSTSKAYGIQNNSPLGTKPVSTPSTEPAPRIPLYRGMNGLTAKDLKRFGVEVNPSGGVHTGTIVHKLKDQGWWSDKPGVGLVYSATDHINKRPSKEPTYDVFMVGEADHPGGTGNIAHELRAKNIPVTTHRIVYVPTKGSSDERSEAIRKLTPDLSWTKPKI
jgi:hypothetical protein